MLLKTNDKVVMNMLLDSKNSSVFSEEEDNRFNVSP